MKRVKSSLFKLMLLLMMGCLDPYKPPVSKEEVDALVVDGFVNTSTGTATVKLSHTLGLSDSKAYPAEKNAVVTIEGSDGSTYSLTQKDAGNYVSSVNLNTSKKYRLRVRISASKSEYLSDYVELKPSPAIDAITWEPSETGVTIYANTHDASGKTRYYQWLFSETWQYSADYYSSYIFDKGQIVPRPYSQSVYFCWKTEASTKILVESTTRLSSDVVHKFPIQFIPKGSRKVALLYSILVQQRALDEASYNYLTQLQKTTESLGSLFDPMPTQVTGNIYSVNDPTKQVLGFFKGGSVVEKRIFISVSDLPRDLYPFYRSPCTVDSVEISEIKRVDGAGLLLEPYGESFPVGYTVTSFSCADCRVSGGGVTTKPDFWP